MVGKLFELTALYFSTLAVSKKGSCNTWKSAGTVFLLGSEYLAGLRTMFNNDL